MFQFRTPNAAIETQIGPGNFTLPRVNEPEFVVWMRTAGLPTFRKLHRIIRDRGFKKVRYERLM